MPEIAQIVTTHAGLAGLPGYTSFFFFGDPINTATVNSALTNTYNFWNSVKPLLPTGWNASFGTDVNILDPASGDLIRVMGGTSPGSLTAAVSAPYASGIGCCVTWATAAVHGRKRLRGRTFIVPLQSAQYDSNGNIVDSSLTTIRAAAATLQGVANFGVWGRPRDADPDATPPVTALTGAWSAATAYSVRDKVAILRSRRG